MPFRLLSSPLIIFLGVLSTIDWIIRGRKSRFSQLNLKTQDILMMVE